MCGRLSFPGKGRSVKAPQVGPTAESLAARRLLTATAGSDPHHFLAVGSTVYFAANDADHGIELWKTDGTEAGTVIVKDISPDGDASIVATA
jgi:ELWxxDGT repeat protein